MKNYETFLVCVIMLLTLAFCASNVTAVPPDPAIYGDNGGSGISSAVAPMPEMMESPAIRPAGSAIGHHRLVVILIDFQDVSHDPANDSEYFHNLLFSGSNPHSMYNYYYENSYGQTTISGTILGWYTSIHNMSYYGADGDKIDRLNGSIYELTREAVQLANADGFNFSQYDSDDDNYIDHIIIIHAGPGQESGGRSYGPNAIWSHHWSIWPPEQVDGIFAGDYSMVAEYSPMGTTAHEFGHDLGLPDLYDTDGSSNGIGAWGTMGFGSWLSGGEVPAHFCAWSKVYLGWIEPKEIETNEIGFALDCVENSKIDTIIKIPLASNEYFLLENRSKIRFDEYLPGEGLLIWHIDDSVGFVSFNNVNMDEDHKRVDLEEADGRYDLDGKANYGDYADPYYLDNVVSFGNSTDPSSQLYMGDISDVRIQNISEPGTTMSLNIIVGPVAPPEELVIDMAAGWNMISLCLQPIDTQLTSVMSSVEGKYDSIWAYDADLAKWLKYDAGAPEFLNDLHEMESCKGYWIMMNQPGTLVVQGVPPSSTTIMLKTGWNLVGYNSQEPMSIDDCLARIGNKCNSIWTYSSKIGGWLRYNAGVPDFLNTLEYLESGQGYWIEANEDCIWFAAP